MGNLGSWQHNCHILCFLVLLSLKRQTKAKSLRVCLHCAQSSCSQIVWRHEPLWWCLEKSKFFWGYLNQYTFLFTGLTHCPTWMWTLTVQKLLWPSVKRMVCTDCVGEFWPQSKKKKETPCVDDSHKGSQGSLSIKNNLPFCWAQSPQSSLVCCRLGVPRRGTVSTQGTKTHQDLCQQFSLAKENKGLNKVVELDLKVKWILYFGRLA